MNVNSDNRDVLKETKLNTSVHFTVRFTAASDRLLNGRPISKPTIVAWSFVAVTLHISFSTFLLLLRSSPDFWWLQDRHKVAARATDDDSTGIPVNQVLILQCQCTILMQLSCGSRATRMKLIPYSTSKTLNFLFATFSLLFEDVSFKF